MREATIPGAVFASNKNRAPRPAAGARHCGLLAANYRFCLTCAARRPPVVPEFTVLLNTRIYRALPKSACVPELPVLLNPALRTLSRTALSRPNEAPTTRTLSRTVISRTAHMSLDTKTPKATAPQIIPTDIRPLRETRQRRNSHKGRSLFPTSLRPSCRRRRWRRGNRSRSCRCSCR